MPTYKSLPKYFAVRDAPGFKVYMSDILVSQNSQTRVNAVYPVLHGTIHKVSKYSSDKIIYKGSVRTLEEDPSPFNWYYSGHEVICSLYNYTNEVIVPSICFSDHDEDFMSKAPAIYPSSALVCWKERPSIYEEADVVCEDEIPIAAAAATATEETLCPITSEPMTSENACTTTCGHVFTKKGIAEWLSMSPNQSCPICRQKCSIAQATL